MKIFILFLCLLGIQNVMADPIMLKDSACKVITGGDKIAITDSTLSVYKCVHVDDSVSCSYFDDKGKQINEAEPYTVVYDNLNQKGLWVSTAGNIFLYFDYVNATYNMSMSVMSQKYMGLISKYCTGKIVQR